MHRIDTKKADKESRHFVVFSIIVLFVVGFLLNRPVDIIIGMKNIVFSRDALVTDYFIIGGYGATFVNVALVVLMEYLLLYYEKVKFTGLTLAALYINAGFAFFGKNPVNITPILLGVLLYAKAHHAKLSRFIYTALFGTCLGPFVTEMMYMLPFATPVKLICAILIGMLIGYILPPLSSHTSSMHLGYNLFNVGFSAGILAFVMMCVLKSFGLSAEGVLIWQGESPTILIVGIFVFFASAFVYGLYLSKWKLEGLKKVIKHPGRAVSDFVLTDGAGSAFMSMGVVGLIGALYIVVIGGDFSGPVIGAMLTAFGFSAFGAHPKNYSIVLLGVFLSTFISKYEPTTPAIQLAAMFAVGIAPIAGQFGITAGIIAGILHAAIVTCTSSMYGGLNLYNNGFSCGWVAVIMVPVMESFIKRRLDNKKERAGQKV